MVELSLVDDDEISMVGQLDQSAKQPLASAERRLERAVTYVNNLWFPVNKELYEKIRAGLVEGRYDLDLEFLLSDLKGDFALFMYCLRELSLLLKNEKGATLQYRTPLELFEAAGALRIKKVLEVEPGKVSRHDTRTMNREQASRLESAFISATASESLASRKELDTDTAYTTALLRQLGLTLIAWNYPSVYHKALAQQGANKPLEDVLSGVFGFSPEMLALRVVREWGLGAEMRYAVGGKDGLSEEEATREREIGVAGDALAHLCEVGETLARANDPERYPVAIREWQTARAEIELQLGAEGLRVIGEKVKVYCAQYAQQKPELFTNSLDFNPETRIREHTDRTLLKSNPFVPQCPVELRKRLKDLYAKLGIGPASRENVAYLVKQIIPYAGFSGGCVFTIDPETTMLVPRLKIGRLQLRDAEPIRVDQLNTHGDAVLAAYLCTTPVTGPLEEGNIAFIAGVLGERQKIGVLYLELPRVLVADADTNYVLPFKALRQALHDCLQLR